MKIVVQQVRERTRPDLIQKAKRPAGRFMADKDHICKWKKDQIKTDLKLLKSIVKNPKFICQKCGRAANKKQWLCKPVSI